MLLHSTHLCKTSSPGLNGVLLPGIDTSNIVEGGRRSRGRVNYSAVLKSQVGSSSESENEV